MPTNYSTRLRQAADNAATCSLIVTLLILLIVALVSYQTIQRFLANDTQVTHTYQVIGGLDTVLMDLEDAETGQRGYLLTGNTHYLDPYFSGSRAEAKDMEVVRELTRDNPLQRRRLDRLQSVADAKLAKLDMTIRLRQQIGPAAALAVVQEGSGKALMDEARVIPAQMQKEEGRILAERSARAEAAGIAARFWVGLSSLAGMLLLGTALVFVSRYLHQREQAENENRQLLENARDAAVSQRNFVKDVLASVTEGRLALCETADELPQALPAFGDPISLATSTGLRDLRHAVMDAARVCGFTQERIQDLVTGVSEAGMNAVAHGGGGKAQICMDGGNRVQVWITDQGKGISMTSLPQATLERGYSSGGSLGHGFWLMLKLTDRLFLLTGPQGTTLVLEQGRHAQEAPWMQREMQTPGLSFQTGEHPNTPAAASEIRSLFYRRN
jgi:CHASE3 domain sensor protein/anti-sigma regulatory factor (Ser/Thr protein kinase)